MRSLSPSPRRYSPAAGPVVTTFSGPAAARAGDATASAAVNPRAATATAATCATGDARGLSFMTATSILIGGRGRSGVDRRHRMRHGPALQRLGAHRVRRIARRADGDLDRRREAVPPERRRQAIDDAHGALVVGRA